MTKLITNLIIRIRTNCLKNSKKHKKIIKNKFRKPSINPLFNNISVSSHITKNKKIFIILKLLCLRFHSNIINTSSPLILKTNILINAKRKISLIE